jgi:parallel beta-helix repeat protein
MNMFTSPRRLGIHFFISPLAVRVTFLALLLVLPTFRSTSAAPIQMQPMPSTSPTPLQGVASTPAPVTVTYYVSNESHASDTHSGISRERPLKTLQAANSRVKPGDIVKIGPGTYRQRLKITTSGTSEKPINWIVEQPQKTVFTGADIVPTVTHEGSGIYSFPFPHVFISWCDKLNSIGEPMLSHPCDPYHELRGRAEQVIVEGELLEQVLKSPDQLAPGEFYVSFKDKKIYLRDRYNRDLTVLAANSHIETSTRDTVIHLKASYNHLRGFHVRYAANRAQQGAVMVDGVYTDFNVLRRMKIEKTSGDGLSMNGKRLMVMDSVFSENESVGVSGGGLFQLAFINNQVIRNNTKRFYSGWQAGGMKICWSRNSLFRENVFEENYAGPGLWFDISVDFVEIDHNVFNNNDEAGLYYEISSNPIIHDNLIIGNGHRTQHDAWGADGGLSLSSSHGAKVFRNIFVNNRENLQFREMPRTTPIFNSNWTIQGETEMWNHHHSIRDNYFLNKERRPHVSGWFNVTDGRHWPTTSESRPATRPAPSTDGKGPLESLALEFANNQYSKTELNVPAIVWGPYWSYREQYQSVSDGQRFLGIFPTDRELLGTDLVPVVKQEMLKMGPFISSYAGLVN